MKKTVYNVKYNDVLEQYVVVSRQLKTNNPKGTPQHRCYYVSKKTAQKYANKLNLVLEKISNF